MTVQAFFRIFLRWWWLFLLFLAVGLVAGYQVQVLLGTLTPGSLATYSTTATVTLGTEVQGLEQSNTDLNLAESLVPTYVELALRPPITERVVQTLGLPVSAAKLVAAHLEVVQPEKTQLIEITGKYPDPVIAAAIANETALQLQSAAPVRPTRLVQVVSMADVPESPDNGIYLLIGMAGIVGLILAAGIVLLIEFSLDRPYTPEWAASRLALPILGTARPKYTPGRSAWFGLWRRSASAVPTEPVWWAVMSTIDRLPPEEAEKEVKQGRAIVVTGPQSRESKTATAVTLAYAAAASGRKTILVDADVRRSRLQRWFKLAERDGVTTLARNGYSGEDANKLLVPGAIEGLSALPAGPKPVEAGGRLMHSRFWQTLLDDLRSQAELVIVNAPAIKAAPEAMVLATNADAVLVTMDLGKTKAPLVNETQDILDRAGATILGVILNES
jgi:capsular exopolysaccharide synthesis family protein